MAYVDLIADATIRESVRRMLAAQRTHKANGLRARAEAVSNRNKHGFRRSVAGWLTGHRSV